MNDSGCTYSSNPPEKFDLKELVGMMNKDSDPHGLVLIPCGSSIEVYKFPVALLKVAIHIANGELNWSNESARKAAEG